MLNCNPDSERKELEINGVGIEHYACVWRRGKGIEIGYGHFGFVLVSLCPEPWEDPLITQNCQDTADDADVIASLPVFDENGAVYKNIFCAICHGVKPENIYKWRAKIEFLPNGKETYDPRFNLTFFGTPTGRFVFEPPNDTVGIARTCPVKTVNSCLGNFINTSLETACREYFAPVGVNRTHYQNPHCAMCNGFTNIQPTASCGTLCPSVLQLHLQLE